MEEILNPRKRRMDDLNCDLPSLTKRFKGLNMSPDEDGCNDISGFCDIPTNCDYVDAANCAECPASAYSDYNPELGIDNNPIYYEMNKVLYDLHAERVKRRCPH